MTLEREVGDGIEQRMAGANESCKRLALRSDQRLLEGNPLISRKHRLADADQTVAIPYEGRNVSDLVSTRLTLFSGAAQAFEGFQEKRLDVVRLKPTGLGAFHLLPDSVNAAYIHCVVGKRALLNQILQPGAVEDVFHHLHEAGPSLRLFPVSDRLNQEIAQRPSFELELAQHVEYLATERLTCLFQLLQQPSVYVSFAGFLGNQVPEVAHFGLADSVDPPEPLLDAIGVPGKIVIHHQVRPLQVDPLACRVGGEEHLHLRIVPERLLSLHPFFASLAAMDDDDGLLSAKQGGNAVFQVVQRVPMLSEKDQLLAQRGNGTWDLA